MKHWKYLLPVPFLAVLIAMAPQDPKEDKVTDPTQIIRMSELQYVDMAGTTHTVSSRTVVEVRLLTDVSQGTQIEVLYENGDYSLITAQAFHVLVSGRDLMDVRLIRSNSGKLRFPNLR